MTPWHVAAAELRETAAIASSCAVDLYGLQVLADGIQDDASDVTRFVTKIEREGTSVLFKVLPAFAFRDISLTKIESWPQRHRPIRLIDDTNVGPSLRRAARATVRQPLYAGPPLRRAARATVRRRLTPTTPRGPRQWRRAARHAEEEEGRQTTAVLLPARRHPSAAPPVASALLSAVLLPRQPPAMPAFLPTASKTLPTSTWRGKKERGRERERGW